MMMFLELLYDSDWNKRKCPWHKLWDYLAKNVQKMMVLLEQLYDYHRNLMKIT